MNLLSFIIILNILTAFTGVSGNRVIELNEKFLDIYKKDDSLFWLVKFYAPWCHFCKQMEPTYIEVAQLVHNEDINVHVARVDCTKHTSIATHFGVKGFPTIMFISSKRNVEFHGERDTEELVDFAKRLSGPSVRKIDSCHDIESIKNKHKVYFLNIGAEENAEFKRIANQLHSLNWFYQLSAECDGFTENSIYAIKASPFNSYLHIEFDRTSSKPLREWIERERFPIFAKITNGNFNMLLKTNKLIAIALVEEHRPISKLTSAEYVKYRADIEKMANFYQHRNEFIFGWTSYLDLINSIAIKTISHLPSFIVINSTNLQYYLIDEPHKVDQVVELLDQIRLKSEKIQPSGGDGYTQRVRRSLFELYSSLISMYRGNPVLTLLIFGLPASFLAIIVYTSCFSDIFDTKDDDEETEELLNGHAKNE